MKALTMIVPALLLAAACAKANAPAASDVAAAHAPAAADANSDYVAIIDIYEAANDADERITARLQHGTAADAAVVATFDGCTRAHGTHGMDPGISWETCATDAFDLELDNPWAGKGYTASVTPKQPAALGYILGNCDEVFFTGLENQGPERYEFTCKFTARQQPVHPLHGSHVAAAQ